MVTSWFAAVSSRPPSLPQGSGLAASGLKTMADLSSLAAAERRDLSD
jgi:hypothetical protein